MKNEKKTKIVVTNAENVKPQYSNYLSISHTPNEFILSFCYIDPAKMKRGEEQEVPAEAFSRIVVTPSLLPQIIKALQTNLEKYNTSIKKEMDRIKEKKERIN